MKKHLYCIRHGETDWNNEGRFQGKTDIHLNQNGRQQALALIPIISKLSISKIYSSPLVRALDTANIMAKPFNLPIIVVDDLREIDVGMASGVKIDQVDEKFAIGTLEKWKSEHAMYDNFGFPEGETKIDFRNRAVKAIFNIAQELQLIDDEKVVIVTHGFFLKQVAIALDLDTKNREVLKNTEILHLVYDYDKETKKLTALL